MSWKENVYGVDNLYGSIIVDMSKSTKIDAKTRRSINKDLDKLTTNVYFFKIPIDDIFTILKKQSLIPVQEDGTAWDGILCGDSGKAPIEIGFHGKLVSNSHLLLTWYKIDSGKYEIVCYMS